jgi:hypothetical protein
MMVGIGTGQRRTKWERRLLLTGIDIGRGNMNFLAPFHELIPTEALVCDVALELNHEKSSRDSVRRVQMGSL